MREGAILQLSANDLKHTNKSMAGSDTQAAFYYQNIVAARWALRLLEFGTPIVKIRLENPDHARHIDDVIIFERTRTRYIQVKWSKDDEAAYTLANLTSREERNGRTSKSLLESLAIGFDSIGAEENQDVEVLLLSTRRPGINKQPNEGFPTSFRTFLERFHQPFLIDPDLTDCRDHPEYADFESTVQRLADECGKPDLSAFSRFLKHLRFDLGQPGRETLKREVLGEFDRLGIPRSKYETLLNAIVEWSIDGREVTSSDVLRRLGLHGHFSDRLTQDFPVEVDTFVPPLGTFSSLDVAINQLSGGFVLLEGPPGSGKSTAITMYRRRREDIAFGYYCYIPDERGIGNQRLEQDAFVRALCIGIRNAFPDVAFPEPFSDYTIEKLNRWLLHLSGLERRTVLFIDGLDHADRKAQESLKSISLISALDGCLPDNILIVLTSRYLAALPPEPRQQVEADPRRRIRMTSLTFPEVSDFFQRRLVHLSPELLERALDLSDGVPLYLEYLCTELRERTPFEQEQYLGSVPFLRGGTINTYHQHLWSTIDSQAVPFLVLLAARREFTAASMAAELLSVVAPPMDPRSVEELAGKYRHLLRVSGATSFSIRHSSFREFVLTQEEHLAHRIAAAIVAWYAAHPESDERWRNQFRHLYDLGRYEELASTCTGEWVREAWAAFRSIDEIRANVDLAWQAARHTGDFRAFFRIALLMQQIGNVQQHLDNVQFEPEDVLLDIGRSAEAIRMVWDGERVRCSPNRFASFLLLAADRGETLPGEVIRAHLGDGPPHGTGVSDLQRYYAARATVDDWATLRDEINALHFQRGSKHGRHREPLPPEESEANRIPIRYAVLDRLAQRARYEELESIGEDPEECDTVRQVARAHCAGILLRGGEREEAADLLSVLCWDELGTERSRRLLLAAGETGLDLGSIPDLPIDQIAPRGAGLAGLERDASRPEASTFSAGLIYECLRLRILFDPREQAAFETLTGKFPARQERLLRALASLAALERSADRDVPAVLKVDRLRRLLDTAAVALRDTANWHVRRDYMAFRDQQLAAELSVWIWGYAGRALPGDTLARLAETWLTPQHAALLPAQLLGVLAQQWSERYPLECASATDVALAALERKAQGDDETMSLVTETLSLCSVLGKCGRRERAEAVWRELFDRACGVGSHKDYQLATLVTAVRASHSSSPGATVGRIADALNLTQKLQNAADGRAIAITVEGLCEVASDLVDPRLAIEMLRREDPRLHRDSVILALTTRWVQDVAIDLRFPWMLVRIMDRWHGLSDVGDNDTYQAFSAVFEAAISRKDQELAVEIYGAADQHFRVEAGYPDQVAVWRARLENIGWLEAVEAEAAPMSRSYKASLSCSEDHEDATREGFDAEALFQLSQQDFTRFEASVDALRDAVSVEAADREVRNLIREVRTLLERNATDAAAEESVPAGSGADLSPGVPSLADELDAPLPEEVASLLSDFLSGPLSQERAIALAVQVAHFVSNTPADAGMPKSFSTRFSFEAWSSRFVAQIRNRYDIEDRLLRPQLAGWISRARRPVLAAWERWCRAQLDGRARQLGLLEIARRWANVAPERCLELLKEAHRSESQFFFESDTARQILDLAFTVDRAAGRRLALDAFYLQYRRYPTSIVPRLENLLDYCANYDIGADTCFSDLVDYGETLAKGLASCASEIGWLEAWQPRQTLEESIVEYLLWLLEDPEVDTRLLAIRALHHECLRRPSVLEILVRACPKLPTGAMELCLLVFQALALAHPDRLAGHLHEIEKWHRLEHINIRMAVEEVLEAVPGSRKSPLVLTPTSGLILPSRPGLARLPRPHSYWQHKVLRELEEIAPRRFALALRKRLGSRLQDDRANAEEDSAIHRRHNINDNYDKKEINGPNEVVLHEALNQAIVDLLRDGALDEETLAWIWRLLRRLDPTDLLVTRCARPAFLGWIAPPVTDREQLWKRCYEQNEADFLGFSDMPMALERLRTRNPGWTTLYEHTEERSASNSHSEWDRRLKGHTVAFAVPTGLIVTREMLPSIWEDSNMASLNAYRHELAGEPFAPEPLGITPLVRISLRQFRGRDALTTGDIPRSLATRMGISRPCFTWPEASAAAGQPVRITEWQDPYDRGRRLHEPSAAGCLVEIESQVLKTWLTQEGLRLVYRVEQRRSTDQYKPEQEMRWNEGEWIIPYALET